LNATPAAVAAILSTVGMVRVVGRQVLGHVMFRALSSLTV